MLKVGTKKFIVNLHHKINWNYSIKKRIYTGWKAYFVLENKWKWNFGHGKKRNLSLTILLFFLSYTDVKFGDTIYLENHGGRLIKF